MWVEWCGFVVCVGVVIRFGRIPVLLSRYFSAWVLSEGLARVLGIVKRVLQGFQNTVYSLGVSYWSSRASEGAVNQEVLSTRVFLLCFYGTLGSFFSL